MAGEDEEQGQRMNGRKESRKMRNSVRERRGGRMKEMRMSVARSRNNGLTVGRETGRGGRM